MVYVFMCVGYGQWSPYIKKVTHTPKTKAQKRKAMEDASSAPNIGFRFQSKSAKKVFQDRFHDYTVIAERPVNLSDLQDGRFNIISQIFSQRKWEYFITPPARPFLNLVREFYANMETQPDTGEDVEQSPQIVSFIRGVKIVVTREVIAKVTGILLI
jgi:hypothetical protein